MADACSLIIIGAIWQNISIALALVLLLAALIYMIGNFARKEEYIEHSKSELYNFAVTLALVLSFAGIAALANDLSCADSGNTLFDLAMDRMNSILNSDIYPVLRSLFMIMLEVSAFSNMAVSFSGVKFTPLGGLKYFYTSLNVVSFVMESVFASIYIQMLLLAIFKETAFSVIMPVGIFLRAFHMTRDAGTFLIALSFSLYTLYPYLYTVSLEALDDIRDKLTLDEIVRDASHTYSFFDSFRAVEDYTFHGLTYAQYPTLKSMMFDFGRHLFSAVALPALTIILSVALTNSLMRFIKEVSA